MLLPALALADDPDAPPAPPAGRLIPGGANSTRYLVVFGPEADPRHGAADTVQLLFLRISRHETAPVAIHVYDPGAGGYLEIDSPERPPTVTRYTVYGGPGAYTAPAARAARPPTEQPGTALASRTFGRDAAGEWVTLGRFAASQGETVGEDALLKLAVVGVAGSTSNLFRVAVSPASVEVFTYELSIRLPDRAGETAVFEVAVPADVRRLVEHNFDLDGTGTCFLGSQELRGSSNGHWRDNDVQLPADPPGARVVPYRLVKTQRAYDNTSFYVTDANGGALPVFFFPVLAAPAPVATPSAAQP